VINEGLTNRLVNMLAIDPTNPAILYAATEGGVFKSTDRGATWSAMNTGLTNLSVPSFSIDPKDGATLYAGTTGSGLFKYAYPGAGGGNGGGGGGGSGGGGSSTGGGGGGCFIATIAFGSAMEPRVKILTQFRDRILLDSSAGRALISFYNRISPPLADFISRNETLKAAVRWSLLPLVGISWVALELGPFVVLLMYFFAIIGLLGILSCFRKCRQSNAANIDA
jgi:hypothetical protein